MAKTGTIRPTTTDKLRKTKEEVITDLRTVFHIGEEGCLSRENEGSFFINKQEYEESGFSNPGDKDEEKDLLFSISDKTGFGLMTIELSLI